MSRTCGNCRWLDPATVPIQAARRLRYCTKRCTWEFADSPRGEKDAGELRCDHWTLVVRAVIT